MVICDVGSGISCGIVAPCGIQVRPWSQRILVAKISISVSSKSSWVPINDLRSRPTRYCMPGRAPTHPTPPVNHPPSGSSCPPTSAASARTRLSTRAQCTIRAPARDHELHAVPGSRKRSGVPCGSSSRRGDCGGGSRATCSKGCSASLAKRGCLGAQTYGDPMRNPMRYIRDVARDPWFHGR